MENLDVHTSPGSKCEVPSCETLKMRKDPGHTGESIISFYFHHLGKLRAQSPGANQGISENYHCVSPLKTGARIGVMNKAFI